MSAHHVYADDGYESSHRTEQAARRAAQRGSARRPGVWYAVVRTSVHRLTGGGHGAETARYLDGAEVAP